MTKFYSGVAGRRPNPAKGVVIYNDAGSQNANAFFIVIGFKRIKPKMVLLMFI